MVSLQLRVEARRRRLLRAPASARLALRAAASARSAAAAALPLSSPSRSSLARESAALLPLAALRSSMLSSSCLRHRPDSSCSRWSSACSAVFCGSSRRVSVSAASSDALVDLRVASVASDERCSCRRTSSAASFSRSSLWMASCCSAADSVPPSCASTSCFDSASFSRFSAMSSSLRAIASPEVMLSFVRSAITSPMSCWRSAAWPAASDCIWSTSACSRSVAPTSWLGSCDWPACSCSTPLCSLPSAWTSCSISVCVCQ